MYFLFPLLIIFSFSSSLVLSAEIKFQDTQPYSTEVYGNIIMTGNTILELDNSKNKNNENFFISDDSLAYGRYITDGLIQDVWTGIWTDVSSSEANNFAYMRYIDIDNNDTTFNSSSSTLSIPAGSTIIFARLYWSGMLHNYADGSSLEDERDTSKSLSLTVEGTTYPLVVTVNGYSDTEGWTDIYSEITNTISGNTLRYSRYNAYIDVTDKFSTLNFNESAINVTVSNLLSMEGWIRNYGNYGAWSLAIIYKNSNETYKHISLYTGYEEVYDNTISININGFLTPKSSDVISTLSVFSVEGEKTTDFGEDYFKAADNSGTLFDVTSNSIYPNAKTNIFDSTITNNETQTPNISNTMGIDIDTFSIGADGNTSHPQIIQNNQTQTTIELSSGGDAYMINTIALSTELYVPTFCYDYSYKQDRNYFTEENDGQNDPRIVGTVSTGSPVEVSIFLRNLVESDVNVTDMNISISDINTTQAIYIDPSTQLAKLGSVAPYNVTPASSSDSYISNVEIGNIVSQDYFYFYYQLNPKQSNLDMPINFTASYNISSGDTTIPYILKLGKEIPLCDSTSFTYTPTNGIFNVVHNNYYNETTQYYNLPTQVIQRDASFKVIALDPNNYDALKNQSTIVAVEAIDVGGFHNTDASCFEQYNYITNREWVVFENNVSSVDFQPSNGFFTEVRENSAFRGLLKSYK
ncbi:MAG: hypothetical protein Q9M40_04200 [Sulfurimonas sp.]|nr:hypothetical protein [Sulfurimonas sp.]